MKKKILMLSMKFPPEYSGAALQAIALAKELKKLGIESEFLTATRSIENNSYYEGFKIHRISSGNTKHDEFRLWLNIMSFCLKKKNEFAVIHSHGAYYKNSFIGFLGKVLGWKSVVKSTLSDSDLNYKLSSLSGFIQHVFLNMCNVYIAISEDIYKEFKLKGFNKRKIDLIPNGVDTKRFFPVLERKKKYLRAQYGLPTDKEIVLFVGVLDKRKNVEWLMNLWLNNKQDNFFLLIVGPKSREDTNNIFFNKLKKLEKQSEKIKILDQQDKIEKVYQASDFFVLPSSSEGLPNVLLEAMATGLPCLTTEISGAKDILSDGKNGYILNLKESDFWDKLYTAKENRNTLSKNAIMCIKNKFSLEKIAQKYYYPYTNF